MLGLPKIAIGVIVALAIGLGIAVWQLKRSWQAEATTKAALLTAIEANGTLVRERDRARVDADAERERAITRQKERDNLAGLVATLRQGLSDASRTCVLPSGDLDAIDRFLRGERP